MNFKIENLKLEIRRKERDIRRMESDKERYVDDFEFYKEDAKLKMIQEEEKMEKNCALRDRDIEKAQALIDQYKEEIESLSESE